MPRLHFTTLHSDARLGFSALHPISRQSTSRLRDASPHTRATHFSTTRQRKPRQCESILDFVTKHIVAIQSSASRQFMTNHYAPRLGFTPTRLNPSPHASRLHDSTIQRATMQHKPRLHGTARHYAAWHCSASFHFNATLRSLSDFLPPPSAEVLL